MAKLTITDGQLDDVLYVKELFDRLGRGARTAAARDLGITPAYVSILLNGTQYNEYMLSELQWWAHQKLDNNVSVRTQRTSARNKKYRVKQTANDFVSAATDAELKDSLSLYRKYLQHAERERRGAISPVRFATLCQDELDFREERRAFLSRTPTSTRDDVVKGFRTLPPGSRTRAAVATGASIDELFHALEHPNGAHEDTLNYLLTWITREHEGRKFHIVPPATQNRAWPRYAVYEFVERLSDDDLNDLDRAHELYHAFVNENRRKNRVSHDEYDRVCRRERHLRRVLNQVN